MATTPDIGKLKRSYLMHYIDASFGTGETPKWFLIGRDIEDMSVELNPDTETVKNILDETVVNDNGYEPSIDADTYYANTGDAIYEKIKDIAMNRLTGDDCKTAILEVLVDKKTPGFRWESAFVLVVLDRIQCLPCSTDVFFTRLPYLKL